MRNIDKRAQRVHVVVRTAWGDHPIDYGTPGTQRTVTRGTVQKWIKLAGSHDAMRTEYQRAGTLPGVEITTVTYHNTGVPNRAEFIVFPA